MGTKKPAALQYQACVETPFICLK